ncbi:hypothetical protein ACLOJK_017358 [Asimina triloba]
MTVSVLGDPIHMSQKTRSKRIMFLSDITEKLKVLSLKADSKGRGRGGAGGGESRERKADEEEDKVGAAADESSSSPMKRLLRRFKARMGRAMCFVAVPRACPSSSKLIRHSVCPHDYSSHRSEDIADCIDFINSSNSSLRGSN